MKNYILILSLFITGFCNAQIDTIHVIVPNNCLYLMPTCFDPVVASLSGDSIFECTDTIWLWNQVINKNKEHYYLIVTDSSGSKRMEGNFFDSYADGHVIHYDEQGRKESEGDYKIYKKRFNGQQYSLPTGYWYYYDAKGKRIRTQKFS
jgi:hypothetical protein